MRATRHVRGCGVFVHLSHGNSWSSLCGEVFWVWVRPYHFPPASWLQDEIAAGCLSGLHFPCCAWCCPLFAGALQGHIIRELIDSGSTTSGPREQAGSHWEVVADVGRAAWFRCNSLQRCSSPPCHHQNNSAMRVISPQNATKPVQTQAEAAGLFL